MTELLTFDCMGCGAALSYAPGQLTAGCDRCHVEQLLPASIPDSIEDSPVEPDDREPDALADRVRYCCAGACGALLSAAGPLARCPGCGAEVVEDLYPSPVFCPHGLLDNLLDEHQARARLDAELTRLGLTLTPARLDRVHVPLAIMRSEVHAAYVGLRGTNVDMQGTKVVWQPRQGVAVRLFDSVRVGLAASPPDPLLKRLEPWDWPFCRPYASARMDGPAVHVTGTMTQLFQRAFPDPAATVQQEIRLDIGGDRQAIESVEHTSRDQHLRVIMVPVWVGMLGEDMHYFVINGRTGEVAVLGHASADDVTTALEQAERGGLRLFWRPVASSWLVVAVIVAAIALAIAIVL